MVIILFDIKLVVQLASACQTEEFINLITIAFCHMSWSSLVEGVYSVVRGYDPLRTNNNLLSLHLNSVLSSCDYNKTISITTKKIHLPMKTMRCGRKLLDN